MSRSVQWIVDRVAEEVHRPAIVEDGDERLVAYSVHDAPVDAARAHTILHRQAAPEVAEWLRRQGIAQARSPVRVPGEPELGLLPRVCFPIRLHGELLGYLWFVEGAELLTAADTAQASQAATELAAELYRERVAAVATVELGDLLLGSARFEVAAARLQEIGFVRGSDDVMVAVVQPVGLPEPAVSEALRAVGHAVPPSVAIPLHQADHGVLIMAGPDLVGRPVDARLAPIVAAVRSVPAMVIGVGDPRPQPAQAGASYREARLAARAGAAFAFSDDVVHWSRLGAYQLIAELADSPIPATRSRSRSILGDPDASQLLETLEVYLDAAGNDQLASALLKLHRGSLQRRLRRVEQLTGVSLNDGMQRTALHLELKVARMTGAYRPRLAVVPSAFTAAGRNGVSDHVGA